MVEDVFEFYYSRSRYYRKDLADFVENRLKIHMKKHNETFLFVGDDGISYTMEEVYQLLLEDPATRREIYGMWMGMS